MFDSDERKEEVMSQMKEVRDSGRVNMMDASGVQQVAYDRDFYALVTQLGSRPSKNYTDLLQAFNEWLTKNENP
jgi:hypothetical protein